MVICFSRYIKTSSAIFNSLSAVRGTNLLRATSWRCWDMTFVASLPAVEIVFVRLMLSDKRWTPIGIRERLSKTRRARTRQSVHSESLQAFTEKARAS